MAGPQNAILGDDTNYGLDLPQTQSDDQALAELQKTARFSKTKEFQELKKHLEGRIAFYQTYLPGGQPLDAVKADEVGQYWIIAEKIINEFRAVINAYEEAARVVKDETAKRQTS